jgi:hypothetical protein
MLAALARGQHSAYSERCDRAALSRKQKEEVGTAGFMGLGRNGRTKIQGSVAASQGSALILSLRAEPCLTLSVPSSPWLSAWPGRPSQKPRRRTPGRGWSRDSSPPSS